VNDVFSMTMATGETIEMEVGTLYEQIVCNPYTNAAGTKTN